MKQVNRNGEITNMPKSEEQNVPMPQNEDVYSYWVIKVYEIQKSPVDDSKTEEFIASEEFWQKDHPNDNQILWALLKHKGQIAKVEKHYELDVES